MTTQTTPQKSSIKQRLLTNLGRPIGRYNTSPPSLPKCMILIVFFQHYNYSPSAASASWCVQISLQPRRFHRHKSTGITSTGIPIKHCKIRRVSNSSFMTSLVPVFCHHTVLINSCGCLVLFHIEPSKREETSLKYDTHCVNVTFALHLAKYFNTSTLQDFA